MSQDLDKARRLVADGAHKRAVRVLWRVEPGARTDLAEARGLLDLASACRVHTDGRVHKQCELLIGYATDAIERLSRPPVAGAPSGRTPQAGPAAPVSLVRCPPSRRPRLAIPEEVLLLQVSAVPFARRKDRLRVFPSEPLAGGRLIELVLAERITVERQRRHLGWSKTIVVVQAAPIGDALLDATLERVGAGDPRSCAYWVKHLGKGSQGGVLGSSCGQVAPAA